MKVVVIFRDDRAKEAVFLEHCSERVDSLANIMELVSNLCKNRFQLVRLIINTCNKLI